MTGLPVSCLANRKVTTSASSSLGEKDKGNLDNTGILLYVDVFGAIPGETFIRNRSSSLWEVVASLFETTNWSAAPSRSGWEDIFGEIMCWIRRNCFSILAWQQTHGQDLCPRDVQGIPGVSLPLPCRHARTD